MIKQKRWGYAQEYERSYWEKAAYRIARGAVPQLKWYGWKASRMEERLSGFLSAGDRDRARVLEIGTGPIGIISALKWGERYGVDPLEDFYRSNSVLSALRDPKVRYSNGTGEHLPFEDGSFGLVILDNVLDHVHRPFAVLAESHRVLSPNGFMYLAVNIHTTWGAFLHKVLSKALIDKGHPFSYAEESIRAFIDAMDFKILLEDIEDYEEARKKDMGSGLKGRVKAYSGLSEFVYYCVCSKRA